MYESVECKVCGDWYMDLTSHINRIHKLDKFSYREKFPGARLMSEGYLKERSAVRLETFSKGLAVNPGNRYRDPGKYECPGDESFSSWLVGFIEGDGHISIEASIGPTITITQKEVQVLDFIRDKLGFGWISHSRNYFYYQFIGKKSCGRFLRDVMAPKVVTKHSRDRLFTVLSLAGMLPPESIVLNKPTLDWIVGFWDAEGTSSLSYSGKYCLDLSLTQKGEFEAMEDIKSLLGGSIVINKTWPEGNTWLLCGKRACSLAELFLEKSRNQSKRNSLFVRMEYVRSLQN